MDWAKAKNILIIILIITNIMIWYMTHIQNYRENENEEEILSQYTTSLLTENNIILEFDELPESPVKLPSLTVTFDKFDKGRIIEKINTGAYGSVEELTEDLLCEFCEKILKEEEIDDYSMEYEGISIDGDKTEVIYKNKYREIPVEKCEMKFVFNGTQIVDFQRKWIDVKQESDTKQNTITAVTALLKFMNSVNSEEEVHVNDIRIVYLLDSYQIYDEQPLSDTAFPAWQIRYNDSEITYISAFEQ